MVSADSSGEVVGPSSRNERMIEANMEHPKTREAKSNTDVFMTCPATRFLDINEHVELKIITKTMIGARNMNAATKPSTIIGKKLILKGTR